MTESVDHTKAIARVVTGDRTGDDVAWTWNGYDPRLQTHTAGLRDFDVQYRVGCGTWRLLRDNTTSTSVVLRDRVQVTPTPSACGRPTGVAMWASGAPSHASGCPDRIDPAASLRRRQPHQRPGPRVHRTDQAARSGRIGRGRAARRGGRRGGPPRHRLAAAAAPDQPAPECSLGLPHGRALALHPRPGRHARGRAVGSLALPEPAGGPGGLARRLAGPVGGAGHRDPAHGGPAARRRARPVRPLLRRPRPGRLRGTGRPASPRRQAADARGPVRQRSSTEELAPLLRGLRRAPGCRRGTRRLGRRRDDRSGVGLVPHLEARPGRPVDAALGPLAAAAAVGRVHRRQPRLRPPRRLPDRRGHRTGRRRTAAPLHVHRRATG